MVSVPSLLRQKRATRPISRSRRLLLELLEDRTAPAGLVLSVASYEVPEGLVTTGTVTRTNLDVSQPMTVWLYSSDTTEATVPESVIIPQGQASADFPIVAQDDDEIDASMTVIIHAEASVPEHFQLLTASSQTNMTRTIATLPDGGHVTAGLKYVGSSFDVAVYRFLPNGQLDSSFGGGGVVVTPVAPVRYDTPTVILPQSDGKILVAGHSAPEWATTETDMFVLRFNTNGTLDNTFGVGGIVLLDSPEGYRAEVQDLTFGPNGSIYLAGTLDRFDGNFADFAVVRLTAAGNYDLSWGGTGVVTTDFFYDDAIYEAVPLSNKLLVVGQAGANGSGA